MKKKFLARRSGFLAHLPDEPVRAYQGRAAFLNTDHLREVWFHVTDRCNQEGSCIIRAAILEDIRASSASDPKLANLLLAVNLRQRIRPTHPDLREVVADAALTGFSIPALAASLNYFDAHRRPGLPANLIQAQRDYFGAQTYERLDAAGSFHPDWQKTKMKFSEKPRSL